MQMRHLFFFDIVFPDWMFVVKCFKTMHWPNSWGSLVQTLGNKHQVAEHSIAEEWDSKYLTICWPSIGNKFSQYVTVIHNTFPLWLSLHNSSSATLFSTHLCFLYICSYKVFMKFFSDFWPCILGPTHRLWHWIYTKLGEFQINTLLYVGNCKNLSDVSHPSKVARHGITSMYLSKFCDDSMKSVNPL